MVHRNFEQTEEMVNNLLEMNSKIESLEQMLVEDSNDITGPAPNLLRIHFQLNRLEAFRNQTMHQAKKSSTDTRNILTRWFERLTHLIEAFDDYILELAKNVLPIVRAGNSDVIVRLMKVVEMEAREDEKVRMCYYISTKGLCPFIFPSSSRVYTRGREVDFVQDTCPGYWCSVFCYSVVDRVLLPLTLLYRWPCDWQRLFTAMYGSFSQLHAVSIIMAAASL